jgi:hypothetical protein
METARGGTGAEGSAVARGNFCRGQSSSVAGLKAPELQGAKRKPPQNHDLKRTFKSVREREGQR